MIRISKLADYGTVIMAYLARTPKLSYAAKDIAAATHIGLPTVSKLLKLLAKAELVSSQRGAKGGYILTQTAEDISLASIIKALDGGVALTECSLHKGLCAVERNCAIRHNWRSISSIVGDVLNNVKLSEMIK